MPYFQSDAALSHPSTPSETPVPVALARRS